LHRSLHDRPDSATARDLTDQLAVPFFVIHTYLGAKRPFHQCRALSTTTQRSEFRLEKSSSDPEVRYELYVSVYLDSFESSLLRSLRSFAAISLLGIRLAAVRRIATLHEFSENFRSSKGRAAVLFVKIKRDSNLKSLPSLMASNQQLLTL
jgi:hypothetical protein